MTGGELVSTVSRVSPTKVPVPGGMYFRPRHISMVADALGGADNDLSYGPLPLMLRSIVPSGPWRAAVEFSSSFPGPEPVRRAAGAK